MTDAVENVTVTVLRNLAKEQTDFAERMQQSADNSFARDAEDAARAKEARDTAAEFTASADLLVCTPTTQDYSPPSTRDVLLVVNVLKGVNIDFDKVKVKTTRRLARTRASTSPAPPTSTF